MVCVPPPERSYCTTTFLTDICTTAGILHTIFFHRFFPSIRPRTRDVLDLTLPVVEDVELETLIDQRTAALVRQLDTSSDPTIGGGGIGGVRGRMAVQFFEKKRRKAWFSVGKGEEEVCWELWTLDVTLATPRTESGMSLYLNSSRCLNRCRRPPSTMSSGRREPDVPKAIVTNLKVERAKVRKAMEAMLLKAAMKIVTTVNREKDHIPPITTSEANPFPYQIVINPRDGWGARMGIF